MCVCVYISIIKSLHYTIGINNIVNHLYLNKNKEKRKEKGKKKNGQTHQLNEQSSAQYNFLPTCHLWHQHQPEVQKFEAVVALTSLAVLGVFCSV